MPTLPTPSSLRGIDQGGMLQCRGTRIRGIREYLDHEDYYFQGRLGHHVCFELIGSAKLITVLYAVKTINSATWWKIRTDFAIYKTYFSVTVTHLLG